MPLSPELARWLRTSGHDAQHASQRSLDRAADSDIISVAARELRIVITADLDFPRLLAMAAGGGATVMWLNLRGFGPVLDVETARRMGSEVHDEIVAAPGNPRTGNVRRTTNRAGGTEGGMTTGEPLVVRVAMKPISTLMRPLGTVDVATGEEARATAERSDVTAVPAMGVIAEAMVAFVLAQAWLEKFGGDSLDELLDNWRSSRARTAARFARD